MQAGVTAGLFSVDELEDASGYAINDILTAAALSNFSPLLFRFRHHS
jgi:hypothetical protein